MWWVRLPQERTLITNQLLFVQGRLNESTIQFNSKLIGYMASIFQVREISGVTFCLLWKMGTTHNHWEWHFRGLNTSSREGPYLKVILDFTLDSFFLALLALESEWVLQLDNGNKGTSENSSTIPSCLSLSLPSLLLWETSFTIPPLHERLSPSGNVEEGSSVF